jgi:hypothetical protein
MLMCAKWRSFKMRSQIISFENLLNAAADFAVVVVVVAAAAVVVVVVRSSDSTQLCSP